MHDLAEKGARSPGHMEVVAGHGYRWPGMAQPRLPCLHLVAAGFSVMAAMQQQ